MASSVGSTAPMSLDIESAFVAVSSDCRRRANGMFGVWVPGEYWAHLVDNFPSLLELTMADRPQDSQGCP